MSTDLFSMCVFTAIIGNGYKMGDVYMHMYVYLCGPCVCQEYTKIISKQYDNKQLNAESCLALKFQMYAMHGLSCSCLK